MKEKPLELGPLGEYFLSPLQGGLGFHAAVKPAGSTAHAVRFGRILLPLFLFSVFFSCQENILLREQKPSACQPHELHVQVIKDVAVEHLLCMVDLEPNVCESTE